MQQELSLKTALYQVRFKRWRTWKRVLWVLSSVVVFVTTYALILPAITMEPNYICGYESHTHDESCYQIPQPTTVSSLVCDLTNIGIHEHTTECYNENSELICGIADFVLHTHNESCFDTFGNLVCLLPEIHEHIHGDTCYQQSHTHTDACYIQQQSELICVQEEGSVHEHSDACSTQQQNLVCVLSETAPHTHTLDSCYGETKVLLCTTPEVAAHTHSDACYTVDTVKICALDELEGHSHTADCYAGGDTAICGLPEIAGHTHAETCYQSTSAFTCTLAETEGHTHGDACYSEPTYTLTCTTEETEGHTHSSMCYETVRVFTCVLEENVAHSHTSTCYAYTPVLQCTEQTSASDTDPVLICEQEAVSLHTHTADCFDASGAWICGQLEVAEHIHNENYCFSITTVQSETAVLTCGLTEHTHTTECIPAEESSSSNPAQENYYCNITAHTHDSSCQDENGTMICTLTAHIHGELCTLDPAKRDIPDPNDTWLDALAALPQLNGNIASDLIAVAKSQLNYTESDAYYTVINDTDIRFYNRYAAWQTNDQDPFAPWNAAFVSFCLTYAGAGMDDSIQTDDPAVWAQGLYWSDCWLEEGEAPIAADLVFFNDDQDNWADRVGIITSVDQNSGTFTAVLEQDGQVQEFSYILDEGVLCYVRIPGNEPASSVDPAVERVITLIDQLPTYDEFEATWLAYEEAEDWDNYEAYFVHVSELGRWAYEYYSRLTEEQKVQITNIDKLWDLSSVWSMATLASDRSLITSFTVYQANSLRSSDTASTAGKTSVIWNQTPSSLLGYSFIWYDAVIVDKNSNGEYEVIEIYSGDGETPKDILQAPSTGFLILTDDDILTGNTGIQVGDIVKISFNYTATAAYNAAGIGTITVYRDAGAVERPTYNNNVQTVPSADTSEIIHVNLFNYGININDPWRADNNYPGFQYPGGTKNAITSVTKYNLGFGDNIVADDEDNTTVTITYADNPHVINGDGSTPITGAIESVLGSDGHPVLAYDKSSLGYLFTNGTYAKQQNTANINGLFQCDSVTGSYFYNSRENHAQYSNNRFTLYDGWITSNYITYPFGNFLPFNNINTQTTQASQITHEYYDRIASYAQYNSNVGMGERYTTLVTIMESFASTMDSIWGEDNWGAAETIKSYFNKALDGIADPSRPISVLNRIWHIDYDVETDFFFGMDMDMHFMMPKDGMTGNDTNMDGKSDYPMEFLFIGDDDVWVFIDDVLFLDLTGIHRHVGGKIDFVNGKIYYYALDPATGDISSVPYRTVTFEEAFRAAYAEGSDELNAALATLNEKGTFKNYTDHTFKFYYMERGSGSSVCRMSFNFPLLKKNTINVSKAVTADTSNTSLLGTPDYKFQILAATSDGVPTENLFIPAGTPYTVYDSGNTVIDTRVTDASGIFTLKAGQRAEFSNILENAGKYYVRELLDGDLPELYANVTVSGTAATRTDSIQIGSTSFVGLDSPVIDASSGTTSFSFTNEVTTHKLGSLAIQKVLTRYPYSLKVPVFDIQVTLDGTLLPVGTVYKVDGVANTVSVAGQIPVPAGSTVVIPDIIAGTSFTVKELNADAYKVTYQLDEGDAVSSADGITGTIGVEQQANLVVINAEKGATVSISGLKTMSYYGDQVYDFYFDVVGVTDQTGTEVTEEQPDATVHIDGAESTFEISIDYVLADIPGDLPATFYYRITEDNTQNGESVRANNQVYIAEVIVQETEITEQNPCGVEAVLNAMWAGTMADGVPIDLTPLENKTAVFQNTLIGSLTVGKTVIGDDTAKSTEYSFTIKLIDDQTPLTGTYPATGKFSQVTFDANGEATVPLCDGETITIQGIPYGTLWYVTETTADDFLVSNTVSGDGNNADGTITTAGSSVQFTNTTQYILPETGSRGEERYLFLGCVLLSMPLIYCVRSSRYKGNRAAGR